jgi:hypothetical protein
VPGPAGASLAASKFIYLFKFGTISHRAEISFYRGGVSRFSSGIFFHETSPYIAPDQQSEVILGNFPCPRCHRYREEERENLLFNFFVISS